MRGENADRWWFPSKRYGWGWGLPCAWQGWAVLLGYFSLLGVGTVFLLPSEHYYWYIAFVIALSVGLIVICFIKGEPPQWRWGRK